MAHVSKPSGSSQGEPDPGQLLKEKADLGSFLEHALYNPLVSQEEYERAAERYAQVLAAMKSERMRRR